jgi:hypothetical protein
MLRKAFIQTQGGPASTIGSVMRASVDDLSVPYAMYSFCKKRVCFVAIVLEFLQSIGSSYVCVGVQNRPYFHMLFPIFRKEAMSHRITVSKRMISYMRSGWRQLCEKISSGERGTEFGSYNSIEDMQERLTWSGALMILKGIKFSDDDAWLEAEVDTMTKLLLHHVGYKLMRNPEITAQALRKLNPDLPRALIYEGPTWKVTRSRN